MLSEVTNEIQNGLDNYSTGQKTFAIIHLSKAIGLIANEIHADLMEKYKSDLDSESIRVYSGS